jgi:predicted MPP superfamily phosphohydrolase
VERNWFAVRVHRIPCLPPGTQPLRVLHISDLHLRSVQRRKRRFLARLDRTRPDLIVATGDLIGDRESAQAVAETLGAINARLSRLFVLGSNDYYAPRLLNPIKYFFPGGTRGVRPTARSNPWREMTALLEQHGWTLINNRALELVADGTSIDVVGLDDPHINRHDLSVAAARNGEGFRLGVVHSPDAAPDLATLGYDLILSGHTHGGQIRIPGVGALVTNSVLPRHMARGVHRMNGAWLHVSAGLGTSMFAPLRFACRPEVCLLELVPQRGDSLSARS